MEPLTKAGRSSARGDNVLRWMWDFSECVNVIVIVIVIVEVFYELWFPCHSFMSANLLVHQS